MKLNLLCGTLLSALFSMSAGAQTCASPDTSWHPDTLGMPTLSGSTCLHETGLISACESTFGAPKEAYVAQINTSAAGTFTTIAVSGGPAFAATLYAVNTTSSPTPCNSSVAGGDTGHCQTSSSVSITHANLPPASYFLIVTGADFDTAGACDTFTLTANGTLPVTLQNFTVS